MKHYLLEACIDSVESALCAAEGGADRLEMCGNLVIGGTTPEPSLFELVRANSDIPVNVLIRPRYGDFLYTDFEFEMICRAVTRFRDLGANGVVVGCLKADGSLDVERLKRLRDLAGPLHMTLHRAFDVCRDPMEALEQAKEIGIQTILTSGQKSHCLEGKELLQQLIEKAEGKVEILVGSGVNADVIEQMLRETDASQFHMSGKVILDSEMKYRKEGVPMGIPGIGEFEKFQTDPAAIRRAKEVMEAAKCSQKN